MVDGAVMAVVAVGAVVRMSAVMVMVAMGPRLGHRSPDGEQGQQPQDQQQPRPHLTSTGRARDDAPGITEAASVESHCSSSEQ